MQSYGVRFLTAWGDLVEAYAVYARLPDGRGRQEVERMIREAGQHLHEIGGLAAMQEARERLERAMMIDRPVGQDIDRLWQGIDDWPAERRRA